MRFPPFRLDVVNQCVWEGESRVSLTPKPFAVLRYLVEHPGRLVTHDELLNAIWPDTYVQPEVLRRYVLEIRRALRDRPEAPHFIQTFPSRGYQFVAAVTDEPVARPANGVASSTTPRLVGRVLELAALDDHLSSALDGRRQVVFVTGEAGIGKTCVVDAFERRAASQPVRVARGQCAEGFGGQEAYYPLFEALGQLVRGPDGPLVVETLATHAPTWIVQFPSLMTTERRVALKSEIAGATRERMVRELCEALEVITQSVAVALVLEDLHWVDRSTLDFISTVARRREPARLLVLGTFRPADVILFENPLKALKQDLVVHRLAHEVTLERLRESDTAEYLAGGSENDRSRELATVIHRRADGNPLFMTALLDHLTQRGVLSQASGQWALNVPLDQVDPGVPDTLRQMLELQLRSLSEAEQRLLSCASVAGQRFTAWSIAVMLAREPSDVETQCASLAGRQQFLKACGTRILSGRVVTPEYEFSHALYRDALYRRLNPTAQIQFHRCLAEGLEQLRDPAAPEMAAEIASHFENGREYERAIRYLILAAGNATQRYAHAEAIGLLERGRELVPFVAAGRGQRFDLDLLERIGDACYGLGDMARAAESYDALATAAAAAGLREIEMRGLMRLARAAAFADPDRTIAACDRAARIAAAIESPLLEARARMLAASWRIFVEGWRMEEANTCADAIARCHELRGEIPAYEAILHGTVQVFQSQYAEACEQADRALQRLTEADGLWERASALSAKAAALVYLARFGEAQQTLAAGLELARKSGNAPWIGVLRGTQALLMLQAHDFDGVLKLSRELTQTGSARPERQTHLQIAALRGLAELALGHHQEAVQSFDEVRHHPVHAKSVLQWYWQLFAQLGLGDAWLAVGDLEKANREADALEEDLSASADAFLKASLYELRARLAMAEGNRTRAERCITRALETLAASEAPLAAWRVQATAFDIYRQANPRRARKHRSTAETILRAIADSLATHDPLRRSFLAAAPIRRILTPQPTGDTLA